jgi:hypothetical protein
LNAPVRASMKKATALGLHKTAQFTNAIAISLLLWCSVATAQIASKQPELNDVHFHLTNYIQQGTDIHDFLTIMGTKVGRAAIFGIPLQQQWSYSVDGDRAPTYYLRCRPHSSRPSDISRSLLRYWRIQHPQGIRLRQDSWTGCQSPGPRSRQNFGFRGRSWPRSIDPQ